MKVYNLTNMPIDFKGKTIPPNGGFVEYPMLGGFIPDRDRELEKNKVLSFGELPVWWRLQQAHTHFEKKPPVRLPEVMEIHDPIEPAIADPQPEVFEAPPSPTGWIEKPINKKTFGRK